MIVIGYIILAFTAIQLVVAVVNLFTVTHLPYTGIITDKKISVLIPARNEEINLGNLLPDLYSQPYRNIEVIVFDDLSDDGTASIAESFSKKDARFRLIRSKGLPGGWLGKNHACHSLSLEATGEYFLFLDADVRVGGNLIGDAMSYSETSSCDLVSIFPMQLIKTWGEWITVPAMNYILVTLLPLMLVRYSRFSSLAAANGQFMFFKARAYRETFPHEMMKNNKVEDILIARYFKKTRRKVSCLLGDERISCRMYSSLAESVNGFSKNVIEFFGGSILLAILFWAVTTAGFLVILYNFGTAVFIVYLSAFFLTRIAVSLSGKQSIFKNLLCTLPMQLSMGLFIIRSIKSKLFGTYIWKGRNIS
ncbi:MAG TPA: glycosyltransferase family 2 protein [Bacteroidales bacterium]|nr:glycosyltransferase family 2 protein [Bacteroidales bacterium]